MELNLKKWPYEQRLGQVYNKGFEYALVTEDNKLAGPFIFCKDFFNEAILSRLTNEAMSIYGYECEPSRPEQLCLSPLRIAIRNKTIKNDEEFEQRLIFMKDFIHVMEDYLKISSKTSLTMVNNWKELSDTKVCLVEASSDWMFAPPLISLYTLLLRAGFESSGLLELDEYKKPINILEKINKLGVVDSKFLTKETNTVIEQMAKAGFKNYLKNFSFSSLEQEVEKNKTGGKVSYGFVSFVHNFTGIVSFSNQRLAGETSWRIPKATY